jgi:hypothetical protein
MSRPPHAHAQRLGPQPRPAAHGAAARHLVALHDEAVGRLVGLLLQLGEERDRPAERLVAVHEQGAVRIGERIPRLVHVEPALLGELDHLGERDRTPRAGPRGDRALAQALAAVGHDEFRGEREHVAEALAGRAHAERTVEREQARLGAHGGRAAVRALPALASRLGRGVADHDLQPTLAAAERLLARLHQALALVRVPAQSVHHHRHLLRPLAHLGHRVERHRLAPDPRARVPGAQQMPGLLLPRELGRQGDRREHEHHRVVRPRLGLARQRAGGVGRHRTVAGRAMHRAESGIEQAQVVVDLGRGAHGRAGAAGRRTLLDAHRGGEPGDRVHVGARQPVEELLGVGAHRLDVAPLPLRIEGVERERRLAGTGHPGHHRERPTRQVEVDAAQVVLARPADADGGDGGGCAHGQRIRRPGGRRATATRPDPAWAPGCGHARAQTRTSGGTRSGLGGPPPRFARRMRRAALSQVRATSCA